MTRFLILLIAGLFLVLILSGCSCEPPNVDFKVAASNARQWVDSCLKGNNARGLWSVAYQKDGDEQCNFLKKLGQSYPGSSVIAVEDRTSLFCAKNLWVYLQKGDTKKGYLLVYVANRTRGQDIIGQAQDLLASSDVGLIGVAYGGFCPKANFDDESSRQAFETCFWSQ